MIPAPAYLAGGFGLGAGLGRLVDAPRRSVNSLLMALGGGRTPLGGPDEEGMVATQGGSIAPALLGALAGGAAALSPLAPFAVPIGAAAGGLAQMGLNAYDPQQFGSFSSSDVLDAAGLEKDAWYRPVTDTAFGMLTDPLSYAGAMGGRYAAARAAGPVEGRLAQFAEQAANTRPVAQGLQGLGGTVGVGTPQPVPLLPEMQRLAPALGAGEAELSPLLQQMQSRIAARDAGWAAQSQEAMARSAAVREQMLAAGNRGWGEWAAGQPVPPGMESRAAEIRAMLAPPQGAAQLSESVPWNSMMELGGTPAPGALTGPAATVGLPPIPQGPPTMNALTAPAPRGGPPFALPPELSDLSAGLGQGYPAAATANLPPGALPLGAPAYRNVSPELQALLAQLGVPQLARGARPPWAAVSGGRVGVAPGILPADVLRGALQAGGYS